MEIVIRKCVLNDCAAIRALNTHEMGYSYTEEQTKAQLAAVLKDSSNAIFVAVNDDKVIGYIHGAKYNLLYADPMVNLLGIAVSEQFKKQGVGSALLKTLEAWALENGIYSIRLNSGEERTSAHEFYKKCGYVLNKSQLNFKKNLGV